MIDGTYEEGRAEGLAVALLAILREISELDATSPTKGTLKDVAGYVSTNCTWGQYKALRDIFTEAQRKDVAP